MMITERDIAEKFSVIWKQYFPLLTPSYMKLFNGVRMKSAHQNEVLLHSASRPDLVAEVAFNLARLSEEQMVDPIEVLASNADTRILIIETARSIWYGRTLDVDELELSDTEAEEIISLCHRIRLFARKSKPKQVTYRPKLKGYGVIPDLHADLEIDNCLYEIKTTTRNFSSSDLKQLFIYLALKHTSTENNWQYAGLYNPRKGIYCKFLIRDIIDDLSGGRSSSETFEGLLNSLCRDIEIDSTF